MLGIKNMLKYKNEKLTKNQMTFVILYCLNRCCYNINRYCSVGLSVAFLLYWNYLY